MKPRIAVVEDNPVNVKLIRDQLEIEGFVVSIEQTGKMGLEMIRNEKPDLIILDIGLPDIDGFELCRILKADERTRHYPIIMLTVKNDDCDRIEGLKLGADDYVVKPYNAQELVLRIRNLLKRSENFKIKGSYIQVEDLSVDFGKREVRVEKEIINLTFSEYQILLVLIENPGQVFAKKELNKKIFNISEEVESRTIDTHIHNLRKKLGSADKHIITVRNVGYLFEDFNESL